jgi:hypothetical protein
MTQPRARIAVLSSFIALTLALFVGCASEPRGPLTVAAKNLKCQRSELHAELGRTTPKVQEYYVACDFMYTRVHCSKERGCYTAPLQPPCVNGSCFKEDPVTLEWEPDNPVALSGRVARAGAR